VTTWQDYTANRTQHSVVGDLRVYATLYSPQLDNTRNVLVWLPPSYAQGERRYPVLYMHDGDNLFDSFTSFVGEWQVDETLTALGAEGYEAIVVGLPVSGADRLKEYNPFRSATEVRWDGRGAAYIDFIVDTVKPLIDQDFRTQPDAANTGLAGSSMGGLISLYGFLTRQDVFGLCGAFSPAYWFGKNGLRETVREQARGTGKIYLDVGTQEGSTLSRWVNSNIDPNRLYMEGVRELRDDLLSHGYELSRSLLYVEEEGAAHREDAWARRLPGALRFLLGRLG